MAVTYIDFSSSGTETPPANPGETGTQYADAGLVIQQGARVVLDPTLFKVAGDYVLATYSALTFEPAAALTTENLRAYLTLDDSEIRPQSGLQASLPLLDTSNRRITVTLTAL